MSQGSSQPYPDYVPLRLQKASAQSCSQADSQSVNSRVISLAFAAPNELVPSFVSCFDHCCGLELRQFLLKR